MCKAIASKLGQVMDIDDSCGEFGLIWTYLKPLCRFQNVRGRDGKIFRVDLAYEGLPFFCFLCGIIGYSEKNCCNVNDEVEQEKIMGWSKTLRGDTSKGCSEINGGVRGGSSL